MSSATARRKPHEVIDKILTERELLGTDRFMGQIDRVGIPATMANDSTELLATEIAAPTIRQEVRGC